VERAARCFAAASSRPEGAAPGVRRHYLISAKSVLVKAFASPRKPTLFESSWATPAGPVRNSSAKSRWGRGLFFAADAKTIFDPDPRSLWDRMIEHTESRFALAAARREGPTDRLPWVFDS